MRRSRGRARFRSLGRTGTARDDNLLRQVQRDIEWLRESVLPFSIDMDRDAQDRLLHFAGELIRWNCRLNLLARSDVQNIVRKHVAASLGVFLVARPSPGERWIDVGTGGGFPGLVLRLVRPETEITLLDSSRKRCQFLESVVRHLGLSPPRILAMQAETHLARGDGAAAYEVLTARAVTDLVHTLEGFGRLLARGGRLITFKGPRWAQEVANAAEAGAFERCGFSMLSATRIPWTTGHLLVFARRA